MSILLTLFEGLPKTGEVQTSSLGSAISLLLELVRQGVGVTMVEDNRLQG